MLGEVRTRADVIHHGVLFRGGELFRGNIVRNHFPRNVVSIGNVSPQHKLTNDQSNNNNGVYYTILVMNRCNLMHQMCTVHAEVAVTIADTRTAAIGEGSTAPNVVTQRLLIIVMIVTHVLHYDVEIIASASIAPQRHRCAPCVAVNREAAATVSPRLRRPPPPPPTAVHQLDAWRNHMHVPNLANRAENEHKHLYNEVGS